MCFKSTTFALKTDTIMRKYIVADNQELTGFAIRSLLKRDEDQVVYRAVDKAGLIQLLREHEDSVVILDYTLFDFADEDQLLIVAEPQRRADTSVHTPCGVFVPSVQRGVQGQSP